MMLGICLYVGYTAKRRWGKHWKKWGPTYLCVLAAIFIMMDQTRHILQDTGVWNDKSSNEYKSGCTTEDPPCLTVTGWIFTIFATYLGFACLFVGTLWNAQICTKLKDVRRKWRELRAAQQTTD
jgi:hypothetical protein